MCTKKGRNGMYEGKTIFVPCISPHIAYICKEKKKPLWPAKGTLRMSNLRKKWACLEKNGEWSHAESN